MKKKFLIIFVLIFSTIYWFIAYSINLQLSLSEKVIRLHIIANSNSTFDQALKLKVRDNIIKSISPKLKLSDSLEESRKIIADSLLSIEDTATNTIRPYADYNVKVALTHAKFPTKNYSGISFPAGNYETLNVTLGTGTGENWWCVMFPPLCFTNSSVEFDNDSVETLKENLSPEEYSLISNSENPDVRIKFKLLEWLNK
jgi:stage II sporulation protein R